MHDRWMIYGAYGFTGRLCALEAARRGDRPVLAGRSEAKLLALAEETELPHRVCDLSPGALREALEDIDVVVHCAGPFSATHAPMIEACIETKTHYLDVTGELAVLESIYGQHDAIAAAGITAIPAIGFDVVPTDCVAKTLADRLDGATALELAFSSSGRPSKGTKKSTVEGLQKPGMIRKGGVLTEVPAAWKLKDFDFGDGRKACVSIPWGDVSSAYRSTGIGDIVVFMAMPKSQARVIQLGRPFMGVLRLPAVQKTLKSFVESGAADPDDDELQRTDSHVWGEVRAPDGRTEQMQIRVPNGYLLTANSAVEATHRLLEGDIERGALTPSQAFGAEYVFSLDGVREIR